MGEIGYNTIMNEPFSEEVGSAKPRRRIKLASWLVLLLLPIALMLPSFAENLRIAVIGREVVCCDPDNRGELEKKAEAARANREQADLIMKVGLIGGMVLAGVGAIGFLMAVVRFLLGLLKIVFWVSGDYHGGVYYLCVVSNVRLLHKQHRIILWDGFVVWVSGFGMVFADGMVWGRRGRCVDFS